jgi:hypothetical protein
MREPETSHRTVRLVNRPSSEGIVPTSEFALNTLNHMFHIDQWSFEREILVYSEVSPLSVPTSVGILPFRFFDP